MKSILLSIFSIILVFTLGIGINAMPNGAVDIVEDICKDHKCGSNEECAVSDGQPICVCADGISWNLKLGACHVECKRDDDCQVTEICMSKKCTDTCSTGPCGTNAICQLLHRLPYCVCPPGYTGDPFASCRKLGGNDCADKDGKYTCGENEVCATNKGQPVCVCREGFKWDESKGSCKVECLVSIECQDDQACINQKCVDPCLGTCGLGATCHVINHNPICECPSGYTGDAYAMCSKIQDNLCRFHECGSNEKCAESAGKPVCVCIDGQGKDKKCSKVECEVDSDCPLDKACWSYKCANPCSDQLRGFNECNVFNHSAVVSCPEGTTGIPYISCHALSSKPSINYDVCAEDNPCGSNAICEGWHGIAGCSCLPGYTSSHTGHPYADCIKLEPIAA